MIITSSSSLSPDLRKPFLFCNYISENCILMPTWIESTLRILSLTQHPSLFFSFWPLAAVEQAGNATFTHCHLVKLLWWFKQLPDVHIQQTQSNIHIDLELCFYLPDEVKSLILALLEKIFGSSGGGTVEVSDTFLWVWYYGQHLSHYTRSSDPLFTLKDH